MARNPAFSTLELTCPASRVAVLGARRDKSCLRAEPTSCSKRVCALHGASSPPAPSRPANEKRRRTVGSKLDSSCSKCTVRVEGSADEFS